LIKIVIFDFDGVLVESVSAKSEAFYELFSPYGPEKARQALDFHLQNPGMFRTKKIRLIFSKYLGIELSSEELGKQLQLFAEMAVAKVIRAPWVPGALEFLETGPPLPRYVVSAAPEDELQFIVKKRNLMRYLRGVYGGPAKKKDLLLKIAALERCEVEELLFIGDAISDWRAAEFIGANFLGRVVIGSTNPFPPQVSTICDLTRLKDILAVI